MFLALPVVALADGHAAEGERLFRSLRCAGCHEVGPEGRNKVGPHLNEIIGRAAGAIEGFRYSRAMVGRAEDGLVWDEDMLRAFLISPADFLPSTRMSYRGVRKEEDIDHLLEFLATLTPETNLGTAHIEPSDPEVAADILAIEGNVEYGQYLSATCVTCHQASGDSSGIPPIINWPADAFVTGLHAYKGKSRDNVVMQQITSALGDEEIAALAAYYESIQD
ncbi:MAG TPA: c-type cytochrome [Rhodobacteraceae bacterium]|nr:c-type cytochrome [Paracoccaceae bacterium]